jgi:tetratricopeptide (TPR) repeat protein/DNA-binding MarR family transcriptional regulator
MRILLHLSAFDPSREGYDLPPDVTQQGIADILSVRQSDVSRALARMKADGQVEERSSSVGPGRAGRKQRLKVYFLSVRGRDMALSLASRLQEMPVTIPPGPGGEPARTVPLREVNAVLGTSHPVLRLAEMLSPEGALVAMPPPARAGPAVTAPEPERFFVGRERELEALLVKVAGGPECVLSIVGIPGVGKTTLARKLLSELGDRRCFYFQVRMWASYGHLLRSLRDFLFAYGRRRLAGLLRRGGSPAMEGVTDAVRRDLEGLGAVLVLDDFHDAAGQPELRHLARELMDALPNLRPATKLLVFSRSAPDFYDRRHTEVQRLVWEFSLGGLDAESSRKLAEHSGIPASALPQVHRATAGHPLSIQLLKGIGGAPAGGSDSRRFLQEEVIGRIPAGERSMLQLLSALRRPESPEAIMGMADDPLAFDALSALVGRSLATLESGRYWAHEMVREAAYGRIPDQARRAIHLRAAALYLKAGGTDNGAEAVHHFCRAGEPGRAAQLLLSLGGELLSEGKLEECRSLLDTVGAAAPAEAEGLRRLRQDLLAEYGDWDMGYEYLFQCSVLGRATGLRIESPGKKVRSEKEWQAAISDHERGLEVLRKVGDVAGQCELLSSLAWIRLMRGESRQAAEAYRRIVGSARKPGCREASIKAELGLGHIAWLAGRAAAAATRYRATLRKLRPEEPDFKMGCLNYLANLAARPGELDNAALHLGEAVGLCGTGRHRRERAYTLLHLGRVQSLLGRNGEAARALSSAQAEFQGIGDPHGSVFTGLALAIHSLSMGDARTARLQAEDAAANASSPELGGIREYALRLAEIARREDKGGPAQRRSAPR